MENSTQKLMSFEEIVKHIEDMPFNTAYGAIAEEYTESEDGIEGEGWWSIIKLKYADAETLLFDYMGGGYPLAYCIDGQNGEDTIEKAVEDFLSQNISFNGANNKYVVETKNKNILAEAV